MSLATYGTRLARLFGRWPVALAACAVLAALLLVPCVGTPGLWEPQERQLADKVAPPLAVEAEKAGVALPEPQPPPDDCWRVVPKDNVARSLGQRAPRLGRDTFGDDDGGRRLPFALLGVITVLATAGLAMRAGGPRAGIVATVVACAMPLLALQSRSLTSEIGTAAGAAMIIYGLAAFAMPARRYRALDMAGAAVVLAAGLAIGFVGGGAMLGVLVPIGAVALAGSLGIPLIARLVRRERPADEAMALHVTAFVAGLAAAGVVGVLAYQLYHLSEPYPGITPPVRSMFGKAIVPDGCYSSALGAVWQPNDDFRNVYDSTFEQIAYGSYPWGLLAPVAMAALLYDKDARRRLAGAIALAWAGGAWVATEAFARRAGFNIYAGFPAFALAIGVWLEGVLDRTSRGDRDALPPGAPLIAVFFLVGVIDLGKDMQSFSEKLTSLLVGTCNDTQPCQIAYPKDATWLWLSARLWILVLGGIVAIATAVALLAWRPDSRKRRRIALASLVVAIGTSIVVGAFWTFAWHPRLSLHLSSKALFETFEELRGPGDQLVIQGDLGQAPRAYTDQKAEVAATRDQVVQALKRKNRVFAIAPGGPELCNVHRDMGDSDPYFVIDDRNVKSVLLSNRVDGTVDKNPLREMIVHKEPPMRQKLLPGREVIFDGKIQVLGFDIPPRVSRGEKFDVVIVYQILGSVSGAWTSLLHIDGALRWQGGDHKPIKDRCPTSTWQKGDYIIDRHTMIAGQGASPPGHYEIWIGFFTGQMPNFTNMTVTKAPPDIKDANNRIKLVGIELD